MSKTILYICLMVAISFACRKSSARTLAEATELLTYQDVVYDASYYSIPYPNGDVPADRGVCADVVIRAYRLLGIDLQKEVHEDMADNFSEYPNNWGLTRPDKNIDHRRVPNLMTFFAKHGETKAITYNPADYVPGDIVCWMVGGSRPHIGIVANEKSFDGVRYQIVHNIGSGQVMEDRLFDFQIIGHYRY